MELAEKHKDRLIEIKENIENSYEYFRENAQRYHQFLTFVFNTALTSDDMNKLAILQKPAIEFNILEAMISRLRGEFAKQEPSITVRAADGIRVEDLTPEFIRTMEVVEAHLRETFFDAGNDSLEYNIYSDLLAGGYSVVEVFTDYINERSFEQNIKVERVFDPTMTGFDPLAKDSHKGDGQYCFKIVPMLREDFIKEYGKAALSGMKFLREIGSFNWSYQTDKKDIVLIADYFEKVKKKTKIVKLSNGHIVTKKDYQRLVELWDMSGRIEQAPVVLEERTSVFETIHKYVLCETGVLDHTETSYKYLPLVFVDGNSVNLRNTENGSAYQMTRPYVYHAMGVQKLKNFSGQTVAAEIENMVQHKFKVAIESIPEDYIDAYKNVQQESVLAYNAFFKDNPEVPLPPPMEIQRTPTPPIVESTFMGTDRVTQTILGSYDSLLGTNAQQVSGVAIQQGAMQSNAAAIPYLMGFVKGLNRIAQIMIDLIPKYYVTPRSMPIMKSNGKRDYQIINNPRDPNSIKIDYDPHSLQVKVESGVNSAVQKQVALDQIIRLTQASPLFAQFINTDGLETILDNMDIRGIDALKEAAVNFMQQLKEQQQAAAQQQDPLEQINREQLETATQIEFAKIQQKSDQAEADNAVKIAEVAVEKQKADTAYLEVMAQIDAENRKLGIQQEKVDSENARSAIEAALSVGKHHRQHSENT